jgi:sulfur carrier protein ThiS adenylyltransferase
LGPWFGHDVFKVLIFAVNTHEKPKKFLMKIREIENRLKKFRVGIAGAGGLGSNCAAALARAGVGSFVIADFDIVDDSNLSRQYYFSRQVGMLKTEALKENLIAIRPGLEVTVHNRRLDVTNIPSVFQGCDVIVEAFDSAEMKEMIIETVCRVYPETPLVVGSGLAGWGMTDLLKCRQIDRHLFICGDETSETSDEMPPLAPRVGIVANMQANTVLEILLNKPAS